MQKRLEFIGAELERLDSQLKSHQDRQAKREQQVREPCTVRSMLASFCSSLHVLRSSGPSAGMSSLLMSHTPHSELLSDAVRFAVW